MIALPSIMVSPTGARRTKADHPALPMTQQEIIDACVDCRAAGATGVHLHVRDDDGNHSIDTDRYARALDALASNLPDFFAQVTSESAGRYSAQDQRNLIHTLKPSSVSVALREFVPDDSALTAASESYHWAHENNVHIQHICYSRTELERLVSLIIEGHIPGEHHHVQLVLGSYDGSRPSHPDDVASFIQPMLDRSDSLSFDWMMCAFGIAETDCLKRSIELGGKARVGFENSLWHRNGHLAANNAERVSELVAAAGR